MIRESALSLWASNLKSWDRILITGCRGWFGQTALAMSRAYGLPILATGSIDGDLTVDGIQQPVVKQDLKAIKDFQPTVVIDTAFLTREKVKSIGYQNYIDQNQKLIADSVSIAKLESVRKYVGFSSGATVNLAGQQSFSLLENPYAAQKRQYEQVMDQLIESGHLGIAIARVWSVSGTYLTKSQSFAFSNLILQAKLGRIKIDSPHLVYRRYCSIEDVLAIALAKKSGLFDTGGELVELRTLAQIVKSEVNPKATIIESLQNESSLDNYYSSDDDWSNLTSQYGLEFDSISNQVARVANAIA
jgi:nucleoside-diphosphate-sugar epimerase